MFFYYLLLDFFQIKFFELFALLLKFHYNMLVLSLFRMFVKLKFLVGFCLKKSWFFHYNMLVIYQFPWKNNLFIWFFFSLAPQRKLSSSAPDRIRLQMQQAMSQSPKVNPISIKILRLGKKKMHGWLLKLTAITLTAIQ